MGGLPFLQGQRTLINPEAPPLKVYSTEESLVYAGGLSMCLDPRYA